MCCSPWSRRNGAGTVGRSRVCCSQHLGQLLVRSVPSWSSSCGWGSVSKPRPAPQSSPGTCCLSPPRDCP
ncbi:unnamed protein product, partial [Gulo gulo]